MNYLCHSYFQLYLNSPILIEGSPPRRMLCTPDAKIYCMYYTLSSCVCQFILILVCSVSNVQTCLCLNFKNVLTMYSTNKTCSCVIISSIFRQLSRHCASLHLYGALMSCVTKRKIHTFIVHILIWLR